MSATYQPSYPVLVQMVDTKQLYSVPSWRANELLKAGLAKLAYNHLVYPPWHPVVAEEVYEPAEDYVRIDVPMYLTPG